MVHLYVEYKKAILAITEGKWWLPGHRWWGDRTDVVYRSKLTRNST